MFWIEYRLWQGCSPLHVQPQFLNLGSPRRKGLHKPDFGDRKYRPVRHILDQNLSLRSKRRKSCSKGHAQQEVSVRPW
jgi:hypothetical protein